MFDFGYMIADLLGGTTRARIWWRLGWLDIKLRYRRTTLGPFWVTASFLASAIVLGIVYSRLLHVNDPKFLAYLFCGLGVWGFVSGLVTEACNAFILSGGMILERRLPLSIHAMRLVTRNLLVFGHNAIAIVVALIYFHVEPTWWTLLAIPALLMIMLLGLWLSILLGIISTRFRDMPQLVMLVVSLAFFVTPVFWRKSMLGSRAIIVDVNPLYHFVEILRSALLGVAPDPLSWPVVLGLTAFGLVAALLVGARYLRSLAYWL